MAQQVRQFDLTPIIGEYLDVHLLIKLVIFLQQKNLYPDEESQAAIITLTEKTNMVDYAIDSYFELYQEKSEALEEKKAHLISELTELDNRCQKYLSIPEEAIATMISNNNFNPPFLEEKYQITDEDITVIYHYAKFQYECGKYDVAIRYLNEFLLLANSKGSKDKEGNKEMVFSAMWGKLSSNILMSNFEDAEKDIQSIHDVITSLETTGRDVSPAKIFQYRLWLISWSLFVFFNLATGLESLLDMFLGSDSKYLRVIEIKAPWIYRYLVIASVIAKYKISELARTVRQEYTNTALAVIAAATSDKTDNPLLKNYDPVVHFWWSLFVKNDFEGAERELEKCEEVLNNDFFIQEVIGEEFIKAGRQVLCEAYCKIHSTIDIEMMSKKLRMSSQDAEFWIVNLIRGSKLDAKIDSAKNAVIVSSQAPSVYRLLLEKTKALSTRAEYAASSLQWSKQQLQQQQPAQNRDERQGGGQQQQQQQHNDDQ